jgi:hypothetical protein
MELSVTLHCCTSYSRVAVFLWIIPLFHWKA